VVSVHEVRPDLVDSAKEPFNEATKLLVLSANTQESLKRQVSNYKEYLATHPERVSDVSYTTSHRRERLPHRTFFVVKGGSVTDSSPFTKPSGSVPPITMVFSGQGAQWAEMGRDLIETDPEFRKDIMAMDGILQSLKLPPDWSIESKH
jgi:acyl transferase domain-containing protein